MCRAPLPHGEEGITAMLEQLAQEGRSWAQSGLAQRYLDGAGVAASETLAIEWYRRAAEQGEYEAMFKLGVLLYYAAEHDEHPDYSEAHDWLESAVSEEPDIVAREALEGLGFLKWRGLGCVEDKQEAARLFTLFHSYVGDTQRAPLHLGLCFLDGLGGLNENLYLAKYYFEKVATLEDGETAAVGQYFLARTLPPLYISIYRGRNNISGHSSAPISLYWMRKAQANGFSYATQCVEDLEKKCKRHCENCHKSANEVAGELKACTRCRAAYYCGRDCQRAHWKRGHKTDCVTCE